MKQACIACLFLMTVLPGSCFSLYPYKLSPTEPPDRLPARRGSISPSPQEASVGHQLYDPRALSGQVATDTDRPELVTAKDSIAVNNQYALMGKSLPKKDKSPDQGEHKEQHQAAGRVKHPLYAFASNNILPIESLRVGLSLLWLERICIGLDASLMYKIQVVQENETSGKGGVFDPLPYDRSFFTLNKNLYVFNPYLKLYVYRVPGRPGSGVYFRGGYNFTSLISGMKSDYYNKPGIPMDTLPDGFIKMDPAHNRVLTTSSSFRTNGFNVSVGANVYIDQKDHWLMDVGIGYNYMRLPSGISQNRVVNNTLYTLYSLPNTPIPES